MSTPVLSPLNDLALFLRLKDISPTTGDVTDLIAGAVTFFIATDNTPTIAAADPALAGSAINLSTVSPGKWLIFLDATVLTAALLAGLFTSATPYLIIVYPSGFRKYAELAYLASSPAKVS